MLIFATFLIIFRKFCGLKLVIYNYALTGIALILFWVCRLSRNRQKMMSGPSFWLQHGRNLKTPNKGHRLLETMSYRTISIMPTSLPQSSISSRRKCRTKSRYYIRWYPVVCNLRAVLIDCILGWHITSAFRYQKKAQYCNLYGLRYD